MTQFSFRNRLLPLLTPVVILIILFLLPPERILGDVIKLVLLHGALVRAGLIAFAIAVCSRSVVSSARSRSGPVDLATQITALLLWIANMTSSSIAAGLG